MKHHSFKLGFAVLAAGISSASGVWAQDLKEISVVVATREINVGYPYVTVAKQLGYFEEEGLEVEILPGQSGSAVLQLLAADTVQLGITQMAQVMAARANNGLEVKSVYPIARRFGNVFLTAKDSPIDSVRDFAGRTVGVGDLGSATVTWLNSRLAEEGVDPESVKMVATGYGAPAIEALINGTVDVGISFSGGVARLENAGYEFDVLPNHLAGQEWYNFSLVAKDEFISENPDIVAGFGRAMAKATVFMKANPEAAVRAFWDYAPDQAPKDQNDAEALADDLHILNAVFVDMAIPELDYDFAWGSQEAGVYEKIQEYLVSTGDIQEPLDVSVYFDNSQQDAYVDFSIEDVMSAAE